MHDYGGYSFPVQLGRELARRGHDVSHLYFLKARSPRTALVKQPDDPERFTVRGVAPSGKFKKYSFINRAIQEQRYGKILADEVRSFRPDVVISSNSPLIPQAALISATRRVPATFVFWMQDFYSIALKSILKKKAPFIGPIAARYFTWLEKRLLVRSDSIIVITEDFLPQIREWNISEQKVTVVENWAPLNEIMPRSKENSWARKHGYHDKTCILYTGTLGLKHNPSLLVQLARHFRDRNDVVVIVVSQGLGADWLKQRTAEEGLDNLKVLDFQPYDVLPEVLAAGDILVAILDPDAAAFSVPSKVLSYLCVERAILLAIPSENLAARTVQKIEAGLVVDPIDSEAFVHAAETLLADPTLRHRLAKNGRAYAEQAFDIKTIATHFENVIRRARS